MGSEDNHQKPGPDYEAMLAIVFPNTFHKLCKWHIMHKMDDKIGNIYRNKAVINHQQLKSLNHDWAYGLR